MKRHDITTGMKVFSSDGESLGRVVDLGPMSFAIEKGFFFQKDYFIRYDDVSTVDTDSITLRLRKDDLSETTDEVTASGQIVVERVPADQTRATGAQASFDDRDITIPITEEEIEVHERPVVREELRVRKESIQESRVASGEVRREEAEIEEEGEVRRVDRLDDPLKKT